MIEKEEELKRNIGIWGLSANLINIMIGAGIFVLPSIVAAGLGSASVLAYLFCGLLISLVMLCFAEIGSKITDTGGAYAYIEGAFGKYFGFIAAVLFLVATISADAAVANTIVDIMGSINPFFKGGIINTVFFLCLFSGLGYINVIGVKEGIRLVKLITISKIAPLMVLIFLAWSEVDIVNLVWDFTPTVMDVGEVSLILFFAFQGAESGLSVSGEVRKPNKTIPRAIMISITVVLLIYIMIQTAAQGVLGETLASFKENPLGEVASKIFGPIGFTLITIGAVVSMFGNLSSEILSMPRMLYRAAKDKVIPIEIASRVHKKFSTPYVSIIIYVGLCFLFASLGGFKQLAILSSASILLIYLGVAIAVIKLRKKENKEESELSKDSFRIPGGYLVPIMAVLVILFFLSNLSFNELIAIGTFIGVLSIIYYLINVVRHNREEK
ncbi:APC family permease [Arenibacter sp. M-2]|uniref:APC family permease n=1 Tax=Arenibacter sp. M-2 TaxID=3053612 RepID=UPI00257081EF|nr:APC family permease [Arenibacter sp. M-2]MDL5512268.1 APC family permease [Arenibacter sp. M-2]